MPRYRVTRSSYRLGVYLTPDSIVEVPANEASKYWELVTDEPAKAADKPPEVKPDEKQPRRRRPADEEPST